MDCRTRGRCGIDRLEAIFAGLGLVAADGIELAEVHRNDHRGDFRAFDCDRCSQRDHGLVSSESDRPASSRGLHGFFCRDNMPRVNRMSWLWKKLGAVSPEEMAGLQLHFDGCWAITAPYWDAEVGFAALPNLAGKDAMLYLEGGSHSDEVAAFIDGHVIPAVEQIARGTIWPRQMIHHLPATPDVFNGLSRLADHHALPEICDHLVIYRPSLVLVDWYDVFDREAYVSSTVPEKLIREFADMVGGSYRIETT